MLSTHHCVTYTIKEYFKVYLSLSLVLYFRWMLELFFAFSIYYINLLTSLSSYIPCWAERKHFLIHSQHSYCDLFAVLHCTSLSSPLFCYLYVLVYLYLFNSPLLVSLCISLQPGLPYCFTLKNLPSYLTIRNQHPPLQGIPSVNPSLPSLKFVHLLKFCRHKPTDFTYAVLYSKLSSIEWGHSTNWKFAQIIRYCIASFASLINLSHKFDNFMTGHLISLSYFSLFRNLLLLFVVCGQRQRGRKINIANGKMKKTLFFVYFLCASLESELRVLLELFYRCCC